MSEDTKIIRLSIVSRGDERKTKPDLVFEGTFEEFADNFKKYKSPRGKHDGYFVRGELTGTRKNANLPASEVIVLDGDQSADDPDSAPNPKPLHQALKFSKINHFIYTTHSYDPDKNKFKWRCVIPCQMDDKSQLKPTLNSIFEFLEQSDYPLKNVKENWTWSQPWFMPNRAEDDGHFLFYEYHGGEEYTAAPPTESSNLPSQKQQQDENKTSHRDNLAAIREGISYYKELQDTIWGMAKDGRAKETALSDIEMIMMASKAANKDDENHDKWQARFNELPTYIDQAFNAIKEDEVDISKLKSKEDQQSYATKDLPWPPGEMGNLCKNFYEMAPHPNQEISIMAGVCLVAGVAGRKYNVMGTGLNIYGTLLADSGVGKAIAKDGINLALRSANALNGAMYIGSSRFTGPKAIFEMLMAGHSRVCVLEESGLMQESTAGDGAGMSRVMLDLYTSSGAHQWAGGEAYSDKNNSVKPIQAPALTILSVSTPKSYLKAMKAKSAELSGEIARMWVVRSMKDKPYLNVNRKDRFDKKIIDRLGELTKNCFDRQTPENQGKTINIKFDTETAQKDSNKFVDLENKYKKQGDHLRRTLCSRGFVKMMKLASVCSVYNGKDEIGEVEYNWAKDVVAYEMDFIQDTFTHEASDDLLHVVKSVVMPAIVNCLKGKYKGSNKTPSERMRKAGVFTHNNIVQALYNNSVMKDLDDDPAKYSPKKGVEKCIEYMVRSDLLSVPSKEMLFSLKSKSKKAYQVTEEFMTIYDDDDEDEGWF